MGAYGSFGYGHPPAPAQQQQGYPSPQPQGYPQMQYTPPSARLGPTAPPVAYMAERGGGATRAPFVPAQAQRAQVYYPQESAYSPSSANTASPSQGAPRGDYLSHYTSPSPRPAEAQGGGGGELSPTTTNIPLTPTPFPNPFDSAAAGDANGGGEEHRVLKVANYTSPPASAYSGGLGVQGAREGEGEQDIPLTPSPFPNPFDSGR
ncbi:hypothetical protein B0H11DRAFT_1954928 [Mycena galericulata]|nr:hypothetical protein B0H11DRAFT_1954928 [Mycena galericulata]